MSKTKEDELKQREISECCNVSVGETWTYPSIVEKYKREYGTYLPPNRLVKICSLCKEACKTHFVLS